MSQEGFGAEVPNTRDIYALTREIDGLGLDAAGRKSKLERFIADRKGSHEGSGASPEEIEEAIKGDIQITQALEMIAEIDNSNREAVAAVQSEISTKKETETKNKRRGEITKRLREMEGYGIALPSNGEYNRLTEELEELSK